MNTAIAAVSARFAAWLPGGSTKAGPSLPQFLKFSPSPSPPPFTRGRCGEALAQRVGSGTFNDVLVQRIGDKNVAEAVKNILEMASRASLRREILQTDFLTPPVLKESISALEKLTDVKAVAQGGYPQAERCRISIGNTEIFTTEPDVVAALSISGNFEFEHCSHGDFLGSIIGTGIVREKVGDILLQGKKGAQIVVVPELAEFLISALNKVGNVPVSCQQIPLFALEYEPPRTKSSTTVEASLRVDAIASAGFNISRSKLVSLISNGDVRLNWSPVMKNGTILKTGDTVSVSGKGRLKGFFQPLNFPLSLFFSLRHFVVAASLRVKSPFVASPRGHFFVASSPRSTTSDWKSQRELARCEGAQVLHCFTMHPPLTLHRHPMCVEIIELFQKCHEDHPIGKFFGECTGLKLKLDRCFREEKALRRKANFEESKKFKERLKSYRQEMSEKGSEE